MAADRVFVEVGAGGDDQGFEVVGLGVDVAGGDAGGGFQYAFDLVEFDALAVEFDLAVAAADVVERAVGTGAADVSGAVEEAQRGCGGGVGVAGEVLFHQVGLVEVAADAGAADPQFAFLPGGDLAQCVVEEVGVFVGDGPSDGRAFFGG